MRESRHPFRTKNQKVIGFKGSRVQGRGGSSGVEGLRAFGVWGVRGIGG